MPPQLVALTDGPNILLDKPILLIGRHPECDIRVESRKVSRRHCCIAQVGDYLVVRDLGSTNGVRINGKRVVEGRVQVGDELTIGNNRFRLRWDSLDDHPIPPELRAREPARAPVAPPDEHPSPPPGPGDELLESCDDPVPLPEPPKPVKVPSAKKTAIPPAAKFVSTQQEPEPGSLILPEHIELAPSDVFRNPAPPGN